MTTAHEELLEIAAQLDQLSQRAREPNIVEPLEALITAAQEVAKAFSGSWMGYQAYVYYENLEPPPPGDHFSQEWGLLDSYSASRLGSSGDWREFDPESVKAEIRKRATKRDLKAARNLYEEAAREIASKKVDALSVIESEPNLQNDAFLTRLKEEIEALTVLSATDVAEHIRPKGQIITRDTIVLGQGSRVPPHIAILSEALAIQNAFGVVENLATRVRQAGSHLLRRRRQSKKLEVVGTNVFIGHGKSVIWRELKDFVADRLGLPVDEFNRVPVAGVTNIARLSEMLDAASIALLIMTGEDEQPDGKLRARMNVIHEAGLFQGRLGFARAIVVLEEGCEAFSNIDGLGQIRFPKGNVKACFEEVRLVLEREGLIPPSEHIRD